MSKSAIELTSDIIVSLNEQLYTDYHRNRDYSKPFGQYVAEQFEYIYNGINDAVAKRYE